MSMGGAGGQVLGIVFTNATTTTKVARTPETKDSKESGLSAPVNATLYAAVKPYCMG